MKVLFTYDYGKEKMKAIKDLGYELKYIYEGEVSNTAEIEDVDVLVCYNPFERLDINQLNALKWIQLSSIGIDQLPKQKAIDKGLIITNNRSGYSIPIGEWIVLKILEMLKNSRSFFKKQDNRRWKLDTSVLELYNKTVSFVGTGSIAQEAAKRLQGFGVKLVGINTTGKQTEFFQECYKMSELDAVLAGSDIVVLSIPYTKATHHLINKSNLRKFKTGSMLVNISRGSVINESDLVDALKNGILKGAALDVFEDEPLPEQNPLWELENVIITPHNSWISEMRNERRFNIIYENLKRYINGEQLLNVIDIEKGY